MTYPAFCTSEADKKAYDIARGGGWESWIVGHADLRAIESGCWFDEAKARYAKTFIEKFCYREPKKPFILYPWQYRHVIGPLFGWTREGWTPPLPASLHLRPKEGR